MRTSWWRRTAAPPLRSKLGGNSAVPRALHRPCRRRSLSLVVRLKAWTSRKIRLYCSDECGHTIFLTNGSGEKIAVVLPVQEYDALMEDLQDLAVIAERRDEPRVSLEQVKRRLRADGLLPD